jgi:dienelactone hydrolase
LWAVSAAAQTAQRTGIPLPGTAPLTLEGDLAARMVDGIHGFLDRALAESAARRPAPDRARFLKIIGAVDPRVTSTPPSLVAGLGVPPLVAEGAGYRIYAVRWPVFEGVDAEGLLLEPARPPVARVVALPDADWTPEMLAGLSPGVPAGAQFARLLAANGCLVLVPVLIDRADTWSGNPRIGRMTNQPHREFLYRMAFEMGRHVIGYEVQKVLAAVDWFAAGSPARPVGVAGYGEGGLVALYSAAADPRIGAALVSGYFGPRERLWREPIYRNVWRLLAGFGDAQLAGLVAPRTLVIEAAPQPRVAGPPPERQGRRGAAPGAITTPSPSDVREEFERARRFYARPAAPEALSLFESAEPGSEAGLRAFLRGLNVTTWKEAGPPPVDRRAGFDPAARMRRQFEQLVEHTQAVVRRSEISRRRFWSKADAASPAAWERSVEPYRRDLWEEVIGKLPDPSEPLSARTRRIYDEPGWTGYEVVLPVWPGVFAQGILLVPKGMQPNERRPVVVCQHGLEGRPEDVIEPKGEKAYARYAAKLAGRGFVVYAPQNPYIFGERFRLLQRKANPLGWSLFSFITGQHQRTLEWIATLPFADPGRIAFYGLSYGGKTAVRVPPLLGRYALSICSADFNEWIWKNTSVDQPFSYMFTAEWEMPEFDLGNTFNYAELASLMAPRPFMVERGHRDGVGIDEWVAFEYAKVRRLYAFLGIPGRTEIEYFDGPHQIRGEGTFRFLHRFLNWPAPEK